MEAEGKGPFAAGNKHRNLHEAFAKKHNVPTVTSKAKKKPPAKKRGAAPKKRY